MSNSPALYELTGDYWQAMEFLTHPRTELPIQAIEDTLEGIEEEIKDKSINIAKAQRNMEVTINAIKQAEGQMKKRRITIEKRMNWLKAYLKTHMEQAGFKKIESPWFVLSIRNNPQSVAIDNPDKIPDNYKSEKTTQSIDKKALLADLKQGKVIAGASISQTTRLQIS